MTPDQYRREGFQAGIDAAKDACRNIIKNYDVMEPGMPELLPCPFCGGEAKVYGPVGWYRQYGISHSCRVFHGGSGDFTLGAKTEEQAIADWNRRADLTQPTGDRP